MPGDCVTSTPRESDRTGMYAHALMHHAPATSELSTQLRSMVVALFDYLLNFMFSNFQEQGVSLARTTMKWLGLLAVLALVATSDEAAHAATGPVCARAVQAAASTGLHGGHQVQTDLEELGWDVAASGDRATRAARDLAIERCVSSECRARSLSSSSSLGAAFGPAPAWSVFSENTSFALCPLLQTPRSPCS